MQAYDPNQKLGEYFRLGEFVVSASHPELATPPPLEAQANLRILVLGILDPLRRAMGEPIVVNSGYRSEALNRAVGGAKNSQHLKGEAADIRLRSGGNPVRLFAWIRQNVPFDQLILYPTFVHVSLRTEGNRRQTIVK